MTSQRSEHKVGLWLVFFSPRPVLCTHVEHLPVYESLCTIKHSAPALASEGGTRAFTRRPDPPAAVVCPPQPRAEGCVRGERPCVRASIVRYLGEA